MNLFASPLDLVACPLPIPPPLAGEGYTERVARLCIKHHDRLKGPG
jgi:hypothetical protein